MALTLNSKHTSEALEARNTEVTPLSFPIKNENDHQAYLNGHDVIVQSADGGVFLGHIVDVDSAVMKVYIELD